MNVIIINILSWLTSIDEGCTHQGSWGRVGDVAGTAMSKTQVAVQSRGPGNTIFITVIVVIVVTNLKPL